MIKWIYFWRLLKLLSFTLLISFSIWFVNFSNGAWFWLSNSWTLFDWDCLTSWWSDFCIDSHFNITNSQWYKFWKLNVWWWNDRYIFWKNWMLYYYQRSNSQSFITWYYLSDDPTTTNPTWNLNAEDFYSWLYGNNFSKYFYFYWNNATNYYICPYSISTSQYVCLWQTNSTHTWSLDYDFYWLTYSEINALVQPESSPFNWWGSWWGWGSVNVDINNTITWDYVSSNCTYQQIFDYAESNWYSSYLCYWWLNNFDLYSSTGSYNPIAWTWKTLWQILSYSNAWDSPLEWFTFWNWLYLDRYNHTYDAMWESYPAVYRTWFDLYYRYWWQLLLFDSVREYCAMKMLDIDFSTTYYKWKYFKNTCDYIQNNWQYPYWDNSTWDSDNVVWVNWVWVWNMGSWVDSVKVSDNPAVFIQDFFNQLKANLPTRYDLWGWFLPVYIITFLCAIILFRFLSH